MCKSAIICYSSGVGSHIGHHSSITLILGCWLDALCGAILAFASDHPVDTLCTRCCCVIVFSSSVFFEPVESVTPDSR